MYKPTCHAVVPVERALGLVLAILAIVLPGTVAAQGHAHSHDDDHHGIHFTHPMFAESVSPDTKFRLDYGYRDLEAEDDRSELEVEGEYAFTRFFSIEAGVHYHPEAGELGETHVVAKLANYALEDSGILLGYGMEFGLPTGSGHGHGVHEHEHDPHEEEPGEPHVHVEAEEDIYHITPFLNAGWMAGAWQLVGWTLFEIPVNQAVQENVGTGLRFNGSLLFHASERINALVEGFGRTGLSGAGSDRTVVSVGPGLRAQVLPQRPLVLGAALAFPITDDRDFDSRLLVSAFWHF